MSGDGLNAVVCKRVDFAPGLMILRVEPDGWELPAFKAGQFGVLGLPGSAPRTELSDPDEPAADPDKLIKRAYSIASSPHEKGILELCIQHAEGGIASTYFWAMKPGEQLSLNGPHGRFVLKEPYDYDPVLMCTGTGVAPFRSMVQDLIRKHVKRDIWLFFGTRYEHGILYDSEFRMLANVRRNFHYIPTISRPKEWNGDSVHRKRLGCGFALVRETQTA